jgi:hypothetical protein
MGDTVTIKVDLQAGVVELDAPLSAVDDLLARIEAFVPVLRDSYSAKPGAAGATSRSKKTQDTGSAPSETAGSSTPPAQPPSRKRSSGRGGQRSETSLRVLPDLNLRPDGKTSLRQFYDEKKPSSNERAFAVIVTT